jgi:hypothetical protein
MPKATRTRKPPTAEGADAAPKPRTRKPKPEADG